MSLPYRYSKERTLKHLPKWRKPSPAMIVAIAALVVSIGGTAVAGPIAEISLNRGEKKQIRKIARKIAHRIVTRRAPKLSVASAQSANIANVANAANTAITAKTADTADTAKTADTADTADTVADEAITTEKLAANAVTQPKVATNAIGAAQLKNLVARTVDKSIPSGGSDFANRTCLGGEQVIGAGSIWGHLGTGVYLNYMKVFPGSNSGQARGNNLTGEAQTLTAEAYCLPQ